MSDDKPSPPPSLLGFELRNLNESAFVMGKHKYGCIDAAGNVSCMMCTYRAGVLPSLLCAGCLSDWRRGKRIGQ